MSTPFISQSWFTNIVTGITDSGLFKNNGTQSKQAIDKLVNVGLLTTGYFIVHCKKKAYAKVPPSSIRSNSTLLLALNSIGIDIDDYEKSFNEFCLPLKLSLNQNGMDFILQDINYVPFYHLFVNQADFQKKLQQKIVNGSIQEVNINNNKRYTIVENTSVPSSQLNSCTNSSIGLSEEYNESFEYSLINETNWIHKVSSNNQSSDDLLSDINLIIDERTSTNISSRIEKHPVKVNNGSDLNQCLSSITFTCSSMSVNKNLNKESDDLFQDEIILENDQSLFCLNKVNSQPLSQLDEAERDNLMVPLIYSKTNNFKRILQDHDEQYLLSKRLCVEETNKINTDQTTDLSSLSADTILIHSPFLDQQQSNDIETTDESKQIEIIPNPVQVVNDKDQWERYNGYNWSNERMEEYLLAKEHSRIYQLILLIGNPVMSKTDVTRKLSKAYTLNGLKDRAIENLVADKLLIVDNWFASCSSNGTVTLHQGYLKGYPEDNPEDKFRFSRSLSQYGIDHEAYHYSFNDRKPFMLPRKLKIENISSKSWCYSPLLTECISKSSYLQSRIELDKDAILFDKVNQIQTSSNENQDLFEQIQRQKKTKTTHNQMVGAKKLVDEVQNLISNIPSVRTRVPKSFD